MLFLNRFATLASYLALTRTRDELNFYIIALPRFQLIFHLLNECEVFLSSQCDLDSHKNLQKMINIYNTFHIRLNQYKIQLR